MAGRSPFSNLILNDGSLINYNKNLNKLFVWFYQIVLFQISKKNAIRRISTN